MRTIQTPVLVVGAGPAGLVTSLTLAHHGVPSLLVEKHPGTSIYPRATGGQRAHDGDLPRARRRGGRARVQRRCRSR